MDGVKVIYFWTTFEASTKEVLAAGQFFASKVKDDDERIERERKHWMNKPNRTFVCVVVDESGSEEVVYDTNGV